MVRKDHTYGKPVYLQEISSHPRRSARKSLLVPLKTYAMVLVVLDIQSYNHNQERGISGVEKAS